MSYPNIYFLGIGGIGMSALARYFLHEGRKVAGYDRTPSDLTHELAAEGAAIHFEDDVKQIPDLFRHPTTTLVVYTPAVPVSNAEYRYFATHGFRIQKRSQMLGELSKGKFVMAVAGTHGKTSTTTLIAHLNRVTTGGGSAFLGGISKNFGSNLVLGDGRRLAVEADEYDRSFLRLYPDVAVVTSADADHLDIYGTHEALKEAFVQFIRQIRKGGALVIKQGVELTLSNPDIAIYRYAREEACDFYAQNIALQEGGYYRFDIKTPDCTLTDCTLGVPGKVNIENAVAAVAAVWCACRQDKHRFEAEKIKEALQSFAGVKRRFEFYINTPKQVYMDDYAHHPRELEATLRSLREMFPGRKITALFQPHLYTRTRDFYIEFAGALSLADEVVLLPIYPARELPISGIASQIIAAQITVPCRIVEREALADAVAQMNTDVVVSFGAGNIDACCAIIAKKLKQKA